MDSSAADEQGKKFGDTYLADLDMIENLDDAKREQYDLPQFDLNIGEDDNIDQLSDQHSLRTLYGETAPYAINGHLKGNIGRFLNHSCDPNAFAQNVFVDSHDLRFPWLAFYTSRHVPANTEITWNYNYQIGCIEDKVIYCHCNSDNCAKRLL